MDLLKELEEQMAGLSLSEIQRKTGMGYSTIHALARGKADDVLASTYVKLMNACNEIRNQPQLKRGNK